MKTLKYFLLLSVIVFTYCNAFAQCNEGVIQGCLNKLRDFTFLKEIKVEFTEKKELTSANEETYTYVFSKGNKYKITSCWDKTIDLMMSVKLFDKDGHMMASSFDENTQQYHHVFIFECNNTGVYYLSYYSKKGVSGCGVSLIGLHIEGYNSKK